MVPRTGVCTDLKSGGTEYMLVCMVMSGGGKSKNE